MKDLFVEQAVWDDIWAKTDFAIASPKDPVRLWIEKHFRGQSGSCLELGCFPGRYLAVFGELGYEVNGIDLTPRIEVDCRGWLSSRGYKVGEIRRGDVLTHAFARRYQVVCSFGLIEHFREWAKLLERHASLVEDAGYLMVETPNFRGWVQRSLHRWLDAQNLSQHNLDAMRPEQWARVLEPLGFEILECGYFGGFDFWVGNQARGPFAHAMAAVTCKATWRLAPVWRRLPQGIRAYSPYCGLLARRR